ncbi:AMP-binding protein [Treponema sp. OMZ 840]|uniref:AMP-dependent synthetase/ligase n=1 Tax=Treponema sp. OMZ 840 TaxID=244313 RepID=UPI003D8E17E0
MTETVPKMLQEAAAKWPKIPAQYFKNEKGAFSSFTYEELFQKALDFGAGLLSLGIKREENVGLISDNRFEWLQACMGIMAIGAADVPRGCDAVEKDLAYILSFAECKTTVAENPAQVRKIIGLKTSLPDLKRIICFDDIADDLKKECKKAKVDILGFSDVMASGKAYREKHPGKVEQELDKGTGESTACIIFTSGTTGEPKGVMIRHRNFIAQLDELPERINLTPGERALCVLPVWHSFERSCEYVILIQGGAICYSKPIGSIMLADFQALNPQIIPAVPRVFEAIYEGINRAMRKTGGIVFVLYSFFTAVAVLHSRIDRVLFNTTARFKKTCPVPKWIFLTLPWLLLYPLKLLGGAIIFKKIRAKLGNAFRGGVSGGGALPPVVDNFFAAVGVKLVEGYGLTETAPVVSVRPFYRPVFGTVGSPIRGVEVRIVGEDGSVLPPGEKGVVHVRGGIVMKGYYKKPDLTARVIDKDGWFNTGDLGMLTVDGELVLRGRIKDTIVLRGGENVEPLPIEMRINESRFVFQSVVVGQDEKYLAALIVPSEEEVKAFAAEKGILYDSYEKLLKESEVQKLFETEISSLVNAKSGFRLFERINAFRLLPKAFQVGVELSAKQEIMRYKIPELYAKEMQSLFR